MSKTLTLRLIAFLVFLNANVLLFVHQHAVRLISWWLTVILAGAMLAWFWTNRRDETRE